MVATLARALSSDDSISVYEDRYCLFLDILGFAERITESDDEKLDAHSRIQTQESIRSALKEIEEWYRSDPYHSKENAIASVFSDSIAISFLGVLGDDSRAEDNGVMILRDIVWLALRLVKLGFLVRGGFAHGKLFHDKDTKMIFGPALVAAYNLEKAAVYPRIATQQATLGRMIAPRHRSAAFVRSLCKTEPSGLVYVDYLSIGDTPTGIEYFQFDEALSFLEAIYDFGRRQLSRKHTDLGVWQKIDWLCRRYNESVASILAFDPPRLSASELDRVRSLPRLGNLR